MPNDDPVGSKITAATSCDPASAARTCAMSPGSICKDCCATSRNTPGVGDPSKCDE